MAQCNGGRQGRRNRPQGPLEDVFTRRFVPWTPAKDGRGRALARGCGDVRCPTSRNVPGSNRPGRGLKRPVTSGVLIVMNERLRTTMLRAGVTTEGLAGCVGVDVKTVERWLTL